MPADQAPATSRLRSFNPASWPVSLITAVVISAFLMLASRFVDLPSVFSAPDAWSYDLRTGLFAPRAKAPREDIVVILIDDDSVGDGYPSRSPVDRGLQATLITGLAGAGAKAIGLDFIYDRRTPREADSSLIAAIKQAKEMPIVVGALDARSKLSDRAASEQAHFLAEAGRQTAHLYFGRRGAKLTIGDQVVRYWLGPSPDPAHIPSLAEALAETVGKPWTKPVTEPQLIAWQRPPERGGFEHPFRVLKVRGHPPGAPITDMLHPGWEAVVKDRIVLIGGGFDDIDRHLTPLSAVTRETMPGVMIHAHILGQILDGREVRHSWPVDAVLTALAALAGIWVGARLQWGSGEFQVWLVGGLAVLAIGVAAFAGLELIVPSSLLYIAFIGGVWIGKPPVWAHRLVRSGLRRLGFK